MRTPNRPKTGRTMAPTPPKIGWTTRCSDPRRNTRADLHKPLKPLYVYTTDRRMPRTTVIILALLMFCASARGAQPSEHWAFKPITRPQPPAVSDGAWVRNPIDAFVLARLERENLKPVGEADKRTLI